MVVMKGQRLGNLYRMIGDTVTGGVAVGSSDDSKTDHTKLWYMRLGHVSECGLMELHSRKLLKGSRLNTTVL